MKNKLSWIMYVKASITEPVTQKAFLTNVYKLTKVSFLMSGTCPIHLRACHLLGPQYMFVKPNPIWATKKTIHFNIYSVLLFLFRYKHRGDLSSE